MINKTLKILFYTWMYENKKKRYISVWMCATHQRINLKRFFKNLNLQQISEIRKENKLCNFTKAGHKKKVETIRKCFTLYQKSISNTPMAIYSNRCSIFFIIPLPFLCRHLVTLCQKQSYHLCSCRYSLGLFSSCRNLSTILFFPTP